MKHSFDSKNTPSDKQSKESSATNPSAHMFEEVSKHWQNMKLTPLNPEMGAGNHESSKFLPLHGFPRLTLGDESKPSSSSGKTESAKNEEHTVRSGESLYSIARNSLNTEGHHAQAKEILAQMNKIIEANRGNAPELAKHPEFLPTGAKLQMPASEIASPQAKTSEKGEKSSPAPSAAAAPEKSFKEQRSESAKPSEHGGGGGHHGHHAEHHGHHVEHHGHHVKHHGHHVKHHGHHAEHHGHHAEHHGHHAEHHGHHAKHHGHHAGHHGHHGQGRHHEHGAPEAQDQPRSVGNGGDSVSHKQQTGEHRKEGAHPESEQKNPLEQLGDGIKHAFSELGEGIAQIAKGIASEIFNSNLAHGRRLVGDCARGPRETFDRLGFHMPHVVATEQGRIVRNSGLFDEIPRSEVRAGDYGVRDWSSKVIHEHKGINKGDSFIVARVGSRGQLEGANDHHFTVPEDGGRYRNLKFYRPNAEFWRRYGHQS